jgi:hypothetical protein
MQSKKLKHPEFNKIMKILDVLLFKKVMQSKKLKHPEFNKIMKILDVFGSTFSKGGKGGTKLHTLVHSFLLQK